MKYIIYLIPCLLLLTNACQNNTSYNKQERNYVEEAKESCPECNGYGYVITSCSKCNGNGFINVLCSNCGGVGYKTYYVSGTRPKECSSCYGTGIIRCNICEGNNRCNYCNGHGSFQCAVCKGYGLIIFDVNDKNTWLKCNNCNGSGYEQCSFCRGSGKCYACDDGISNCPKCWGSGKFGQESYSDTRKEECSYCNGIGCHKTNCHECNGSGKCRKDCDNCNGEGIIVRKN